MNGRFKIFLRKRQHTYQGADVIVQCNPSTGYAEYVPGTIDSTWYDYTNFIEGAEKLSFTWDKVNTGSSTAVSTNQDGSNYDKGITSDLMFFDDAFKFIYEWMMTGDCQILNTVEVKIVDLIAGGTFRIFEVKNDNIEYAPVDEPCQVNIKLRERDGVWHCVHKTFIWDNWQNWFDNTGAKDHPCFLTCVEPRPRILSSVRLGLLMFYHSAPPVAFLTGSTRVAARKILGIDHFVDSPLIRTYIKNAAMKCGLLTDTIFDEGREWENLCLFYPQAGFMHQADSDDVASFDLFYNFDNRWNITIADLLDKLKPVFAAEWYVTPNNTLVFKHTKDLINLSAIYDFTAAGAVPIYGLRYTFNGEKKPAYGRYEYQTDGSDLASQEMSTLYSDIVDYDGPANNPMLEGERTKNFEFAPTGFVRDGRSPDYINALIQDGFVVGTILIIILVTIGAALAPVLIGGLVAAAGLVWEGSLIGKRNMLKANFVDVPETYTGAVRITSDQVMTPRLLLWDGVNIRRAKVVKSTYLPTANTFYNPPPSKMYHEENSIAEDNPTLSLYNYPLYFDGNFLGNLFDKYHDEIDNPLKSKESHQEFKFYVDLCDEMLKVFGVFDNAYIAIGRVIKIESRDNYDVYGRIGNVAVDYDANRINLKGKVLRR